MPKLSKFRVVFRQCHGPIPPTGMVALQSGSAAVQINSRSVLKMPQTFQQWSAVRHKPKNDGCHILDGQSSRKWNVHNFVSVFQKLTVNSCQFTTNTVCVTSGYLQNAPVNSHLHTRQRIWRQPRTCS